MTSVRDIQLTFPCRLGPDILGVPSGPTYVPMLRSGWDHTRGTGWDVVSCKSGRSLDCLSTIEEHAIYCALLDPTVLDIRMQYPAYDRKRLAAYMADPSRRIPRSLVPTLDIVLTRLDLSSSTGIRHEVVFVKPIRGLRTIEVQRRIAREEEFCMTLGWRLVLFTDRDISLARTSAAKTLCNMVKHLDLDGVREQCRSAAPRIVAQADGRSLRELKKSLGRSLGISAHDAGPLIAAAALHGLVSIDLEARFDNESPLRLLR